MLKPIRHLVGIDQTKEKSFLRVNIAYLLSTWIIAVKWKFILHDSQSCMTNSLNAILFFEWKNCYTTSSFYVRWHTRPPSSMNLFLAPAFFGGFFLLTNYLILLSLSRELFILLPHYYKIFSGKLKFRLKPF